MAKVPTKVISVQLAPSLMASLLTHIFAATFYFALLGGGLILVTSNDAPGFRRHAAERRAEQRQSIEGARTEAQRLRARADAMDEEPELERLERLAQKADSDVPRYRSIRSAGLIVIACMLLLWAVLAALREYRSGRPRYKLLTVIDHAGLRESTSKE